MFVVFFLAEQYAMAEDYAYVEKERSIVYSTNKKILKKVINDETFRQNIGIDLFNDEENIRDINPIEFAIVEA